MIKDAIAAFTGLIMAVCLAGRWVVVAKPACACERCCDERRGSWERGAGSFAGWPAHEYGQGEQIIGEEEIIQPYYCILANINTTNVWI
jgi:hypothetical protein